MQVQNIQRPSLFSEFFTLELMWNNEYLTYIQVGIKSVTSKICKITKIHTDNIKKSLKSAKNKTSYVNDKYELHRLRRISLRYSIKTTRIINFFKRLDNKNAIT